MTKVLLFVPGLLGSELIDDEGLVWPGSLLNGIVGFNEERFQRLLNPELRVGDVIGRVGFLVDIYAQWLKAFSRLRRENGFMFSAQTNPPTLYTAPYDWRIDLAVSAEQRLATMIRKIDADWNGRAEIHIVAHSLGGLLTRHYLQSGKFNAEPGFSAIRSLTTFGTPHNGAPVALAGALGLHATNFMSVNQSMRLANDDRYPALYQTFPLFDAPIIWKRKKEGYLETITLSDRQFATEHLKLNSKNLDSALEFRKTIDLATNPLPNNIRTFVMIGSRFSTITHFSWNGSVIDKVETTDAGDGTVSLQGAFLPGLQVQFTGRSHVDLIASDEARLAFQELFDADGLLEAEEDRIEISVRDVVVAAGTRFEALLHAEFGSMSFDGEIAWERAIQEEGKKELSEKDFKLVNTPARKPIRYVGPAMGDALLRLTAPSTTGFYRLVLKVQGQTDSRSKPFMVRPN
jgi:hypothetical protein